MLGPPIGRKSLWPQQERTAHISRQHRRRFVCDLPGTCEHARASLVSECRKSVAHSAISLKCRAQPEPCGPGLPVTSGCRQSESERADRPARPCGCQWHVPTPSHWHWTRAGSQLVRDDSMLPLWLILRRPPRRCKGDARWCGGGARGTRPGRKRGAVEFRTLNLAGPGGPDPGPHSRPGGASHALRPCGA